MNRYKKYDLIIETIALALLVSAGVTIKSSIDEYEDENKISDLIQTHEENDYDEDEYDEYTSPDYQYALGDCEYCEYYLHSGRSVSSRGRVLHPKTIHTSSFREDEEETLVIRYFTGVKDFLRLSSE